MQPERKPEEARPSWTLDDVPWERFDSSRVDPGHLKAIKGACMVEHHSEDYVAYLCSVFHGDPAFQAEARAWGIEELRHGQALRRWCELADPSFDFEARFARFKAGGHQLPTQAVESVRGSRTKELVARCFVESGTSAFYSALRDATDEPVLRHICHRIAGDEYRHYRLFYSNKKRYGAIEKPSMWAGLWIALGRLAESGDDELAYAYYAANGADHATDGCFFHLGQVPGRSRSAPGRVCKTADQLGDHRLKGRDGDAASYAGHSLAVSGHHRGGGSGHSASFPPPAKAA